MTKALDAALAQAGAAGTPLAGLRNRIINGCLRVNARYPSGIALTAGQFVLVGDRWMVYTNGATVAVGSSVTGPNGSTNTLRATPSTSGSISIQFVQRIESANLKDLVGGKATLSFKARCGAAVATNSIFVRGDLPGSTDTYSTYGSGNGFPLVYLAKGLNAGEWTSFSYTFDVGSGIATGLQLVIGFPGTANGVYVEIAEVQLEAGPVATPFEHRPIGLEVQLCQRYFEKMSATFIGSAYALGAMVGGYLSYLTRKRISATITLSPPSENVNLNTVNASWAGDGTYGFRLYANGAAAGNAYYTNIATADAEL